MSITVNESLKRHCETLTAKNNHLEEIIKGLGDKLVLRDKFVEKLNNDLTTKQNELEGFKNWCQELNGEIFSLENKIEDLEEVIKDLKGEI